MNDTKNSQVPKKRPKLSKKERAKRNTICGSCGENLTEAGIFFGDDYCDDCMTGEYK